MSERPTKNEHEPEEGPAPCLCACSQMFPCVPWSGTCHSTCWHSCLTLPQRLPAQTVNGLVFQFFNLKYALAI